MTRPDPLAEAEEIAVRHVRDVARTLVLPSFGAAGDHHWASFTQVQTQADEEAGRALQARFAESFPGDELIVEDQETVPGESGRTWLIDPIDGSANHLRGIPYVSITAGMVEDGVGRVGVVHDLVRDITFSACRGGDVHIHGAAPHTTVRLSPTPRLRDAILIAHLSRKGPLVNVPDALQHLLMRVRKIRCMGSIALDLALLVAGEADLLVVGRGRPQRMLDITGGMIVLEAAGGAVMTADGNPVNETTKTLIAGAPALCAAFVEAMAGFDLEGWDASQAPSR